MKRLKLSLLFLGVSISSLIAQKTIYEALGIEPTVCDVSKFVESNIEQYIDDIVVDYEIGGPDDPAVERKMKSIIKEEIIKTNDFSEAFKNTSRFYKKEKAPNHRLSFRNGDYLFKENNRWGVKDKTGAVLKKADFYHITRDTIQNGFVGYTDFLCNYYAAGSYEPIFKKDFYYVEPLVNGHFIIQTEEGYGVISAKSKIILQPVYRKIVSKSYEGKNYYFVEHQEDQLFLFLEAKQKTIWLKGFMNINYGSINNTSISFWDKKHIVIGEMVIDLKNNTQIPCDENFNVKPVDTKAKLLFILANDRNRRGYLTDYSGKLVCKTKFYNISAFFETGLAVAVIKEREQLLNGVIDQKGRWVIPPKYFQIYAKKDYFFVANSSFKVIGVYTRAGKEVIRPGEQQYDLISGDKLLVLHDEGKGNDVLRVSDEKIIKKGLPFIEISKQACGEEDFYAGYLRYDEKKQKRFYHLLDKDFELVFPETFTAIIKKENHLELYDGEHFIGYKIFNCDGTLKSWELDGDGGTNFLRNLKIDKDFEYIYIYKNFGFFKFPDGSAREHDEVWYEGKAKSYKEAPDKSSMGIKGLMHAKSANFKDFYIGSRDQKYGVFNKAGETIIAPQFSYLAPFDSEIELFAYNIRGTKERGFITKEGTYLFNKKYKQVYYSGHGLFTSYDGEYRTILDRNGKVILSKRKGIVYLDGGIIKVKRGKKIVERYTITGTPIN